MKQLWAPWRMEYIEDGTISECIFCAAAGTGGELVLARSEHCLVMMNRYPYTNGHLLVAPLRHTANLEGLSTAEMLGMMEMAARCCRVLGKVMSPDGFNIGMNLGEHAGAGVADHLHMHVVPRWSGDTSFMAVIDDVRVIPQSLRETAGVLREHFQRVGEEA